jgi:hypothetical protein
MRKYKNVQSLIGAVGWMSMVPLAAADDGTIEPAAKGEHADATKHGATEG